MNGDIGKLPAGAGYPASPEALATIGTSAPALDYSVMNGGAPAGELMLDTGVGSLEPLPQLAMGMGGAVGYAPIEMAPLTDVTVPPNQMGEHSTPNMPLDQLKQMLSSQLEYYFSRENLANDAYLLSQMDNDQYVPIWTVANFNQVKKLTTDIKLITEVLRESPNVQVDEEGQKVRPNHKRCIVILREIPDSTPLEDVKNLFSGEGCPRFISCEFAHNSSWYVTFESDEDAQKAYRFLREEVREFQGKPIMARIKAKPMNRLPIPAVTNVGGMKNGYRTPPPPPVFDPSSYPTGQQRFLYTNGTTMPQTTMPPYPNQVHVYHPPFYHAGMMPWGPASPAYFDMTSVFTMNGIASHSSFKPHNARFNQRNNNTYSRNKQRNGSDRSGLMDSGGNMVPMTRTSHPPLSGGPVSIGVAAPTLSNILPSAKPISSSYPTGTKFQSSHTPNVVGEAQYTSSHANKGSQESDAQAQDSTIQFPRHRTHRRTKDQETLSKANSSSNSLPSIREASGPSSSTSSTQHNRGVQFDLEAAAFPPLPGLDVNASKPHNSSSESTNPDSTQSQNRLSDVVKGTAKLKSTNKDKDPQQAQQQQHQQQSTGPVTSPPQYHHHNQQYHQPQHHQQHHQPHQQHHVHHQHHHHQQQHHHQPHQQHHHHHQHQALINSQNSRSTSPGNQQQHHHQRVSSEAAAAAASSSAAAAPSNSNTPANNNGDSDVALGTVTLTPPSSPDKSIKTDDSNMVNGVDEAISTNALAATSAFVPEDTDSVNIRCDCDNIPIQNTQSHSGLASACSTDLARPSYAQVAQHSREQSCAKHKNDERNGSA
ncbi:la-related protein Larp4B isoform X2 [Nasonia vitripennis]|uniref:HTH La-type RNA-binding domain-containing protein n=1 Tax=Nasonia vitripennis TaxID=7425 RepID=A0A7M7QA29_NASVI|nr:la-related protein Larp4B isoform X2 [Nasonia vitripennis]XP_032457016.1 la-related protein Larp4B isoform X2 [Nasonia vitripennis]XP_032457018.1 la-related protein Larp4B isoform X2 [Nasonia vitripennis]